jgi:gamma-glutamylcyclotransferase (GGCT)/AIG2-like uncharacterized protein YtfP
MSNILIATYGSLRKGEYNYDYFKHIYGDEIEYQGTTVINGYTLHSLGAYPAINPTDEQSEVTVDVLRVSEVVNHYIDQMELNAGYYIVKEEVILNDKPTDVKIYVYGTNLDYGL